MSRPREHARLSDTSRNDACPARRMVEAMNWLSGALSAIISVTAVAAVYLLNCRHTYYELARSLHQDLTSGPVAEARATLAPLRYGNPQQRRQVDPHQALDAYFTALDGWAVTPARWTRRVPCSMKNSTC